MRTLQNHLFLSLETPGHSILSEKNSKSFGINNMLYISTFGKASFCLFVTVKLKLSIVVIRECLLVISFLLQNLAVNFKLQKDSELTSIIRWLLFEKKTVLNMTSLNTRSQGNLLPGLQGQRKMKKVERERRNLFYFSWTVVDCKLMARRFNPSKDFLMVNKEIVWGIYNL